MGTKCPVLRPTCCCNLLKHALPFQITLQDAQGDLTEKLRAGSPAATSGSSPGLLLRITDSAGNQQHVDVSRSVGSWTKSPCPGITLRSNVTEQEILAG